MEQGLNIGDLISVLKRRWPLGLAPVVVLAPLALILALTLPPSYSSTARILVESQQIPTELARSTVTAGAIERVRLIEQRLTTRQNLIDIAERFDVFADRPDMSPTEVFEAMRAATTIQSIALATQGRGEVTASAINISFRASRAAVAAQVANEFVSMVLEQNVRQRSARAVGTLNFFTQEVERLSREMASLEAELTSFKAENDGALPDSLEFRRNELSSIEARLFERQLRQIALDEELRVMEGALASGVDAGDGPRSPEEQEVARLRSALAQQRAVLADTHPTIRAMVARIEALEAQIAPVAAADGSAPVTSSSLRLERQISLMRNQLDLLTSQQATETERAEALRVSIERTPQIEVTLNRLERRLESLQVQHRDAVLKQADAATGERLEVNQQAERFEVIEQALPPARPDSPNRPLIAIGGVGLGGALGAGLMALIELLNRRIRTPRDVERALEQRPFVTIPYVSTARETFWRRFRQRSAAAAVLILAPLGLYAVDQFYRPLPLLIDDIVARTGVDRAITVLEKRLGG